MIFSLSAYFVSNFATLNHFFFLLLVSHSLQIAAIRTWLVSACFQVAQHVVTVRINTTLSMLRDLLDAHGTHVMSFDWYPPVN